MKRAVWGIRSVIMYPKSFHHKEKDVFLNFFNVVSVADDGGSLTLLWSSFRSMCKSGHCAVHLNTYMVLCVNYSSVNRRDLEKASSSEQLSLLPCSSVLILYGSCCAGHPWCLFVSQLEASIFSFDEV